MQHFYLKMNVLFLIRAVTNDYFIIIKTANYFHMSEMNFVYKLSKYGKKMLTISQSPK